MKTLIIYANPKSESLSFSVKDVLQQTLESKGHEVVVRDLYALQFNPVLSAQDQADNNQGKLPDDIKREQEFVAWADAVLFVYPIWWTGLPAIIKGYFDRIFLYGFAYSFGKDGISKMLTGKKVYIFNNHGLPKELYDQGMYHALKMTSDEGIFNFVGMEVVEHLFFPSAMSAGDEQKQAYLEDVKRIAVSL